MMTIASQNDGMESPGQADDHAEHVVERGILTGRADHAGRHAQQHGDHDGQHGELERDRQERPDELPRGQLVPV